MQMREILDSGNGVRHAELRDGEDAARAYRVGDGYRVPSGAV
jgi:hypothetical protein